MRVQLVATVAVETVPPAALLASNGVGIHDFGNALVAAEELRHVRGEIDQDVPAPHRRLVYADQHGFERRLGRLAAQDAMRDEAALREGPQEVVELPRFVVRRRVDEDVVIELRGFIDDLAGQVEASVVGVTLQDVEIDLRHCPPAF
jgi:hypothetical protein